MQLIEPNFSDISHPRIPRKNLAEYKIEQETKKTEALTKFKNFLAEQHFTQKTETGGHTIVKIFVIIMKIMLAWSILLKI